MDVVQSLCVCQTVPEPASTTVHLVRVVASIEDERHFQEELNVQAVEYCLSAGAVVLWAMGSEQGSPRHALRTEEVHTICAKNAIHSG